MFKFSPKKFQLLFRIISEFFLCAIKSTLEFNNFITAKFIIIFIFII